MAGPHSRYDPNRHPGIVLATARKGKTNEEIAEALGIVLTTLKEWRKKYPEIATALKTGKAEADSMVEASLFQRANGYEIDVVETTEYSDGTRQIKKTKKHIPPDTTAQIFWLKNRNPDEWRDRQQTEITGRDGGPIQLTTLSDEELIKKAREILK